MALKFGSKAWRAKYLKNAGKKKAKRKTAKRKTATKRATKRNSAKRRVLRNPPRKWTNVRQMRVVKDRHGNDIVEYKK